MRQHRRTRCVALRMMITITSRACEVSCYHHLLPSGTAKKRLVGGAINRSILEVLSCTVLYVRISPSRHCTVPPWLSAYLLTASPPLLTRSYAANCTSSRHVYSSVQYRGIGGCAFLIHAVPYSASIAAFSAPRTSRAALHTPSDQLCSPLLRCPPVAYRRCSHLPAPLLLSPPSPP